MARRGAAPPPLAPPPTPVLFLLRAAAHTPLAAPGPGPCACIKGLRACFAPAKSLKIAFLMCVSKAVESRKFQHVFKHTHTIRPLHRVSHTTPLHKSQLQRARRRRGRRPRRRRQAHHLAAEALARVRRTAVANEEGGERRGRRGGGLPRKRCGHREVWGWGGVRKGAVRIGG